MKKKPFLTLALATALVSLVLGVFAADPVVPGRGGLLNRNRGNGMNRPGANRPNRMGMPGANRAPTPPGPVTAPAPAAGEASPAENDGKEHSLNWDQAPSEMILQAYAAEVGKTLLIDPQTPKAQITLKSEAGRQLSKEEYLEAIEVVLEMNQIHVEPYGEAFVKALPRKSVRNEGIPLIMDNGGKSLPESGKVVSMMIKFQHISAKEEAKEALDQFKSASGILIAFERTNSILVTDTQQNINRMLEIARSIDIQTPVLENVFVRQIKYASAEDVKVFLEKIVEDSMKLMEKSGKGQQAVNQPRPQPFSPTSRLLRNQSQPQTPAANVSTGVSVSEADRGFIRGNVLILADERSNKLVIKSLKSNMDFFDKVIEQIDVETTPDTVVKVYRLKYADSEDVSDMINDLIGNAPSGKSSSKGSQNQTSKKGGAGRNLTSGGGAQAAARKSVNQRSGESKTGELSKDNTTVLSDKRINGIVVMTEKDLVPTLESIIESMDVKLSQVLIETMIIEVNLGDDLKSGIDWIQKGRYQYKTGSTNPQGMPTYYTQRTTTVTDETTGDTRTSTSYLTDLVPSGYSKSTTTSGTNPTTGNKWTQTVTDTASSFAGSATKVATDGFLNYYTAGSATAIGAGQGGEMMGGLAQGITSNLFGSALNFMFSSDELGIAALLQATKSDSRAKYVASPIIMTLDNKEATINATEMHYLLKGFTSSGNSYSTIAVPDYEQKELGIEIKTTPKINPNGTVMLEVETKYTQLGAEEPIQYSTGNVSGNGGSALQSVNVPTTITREMDSDVLLENGQTVVFGGMTQTTTSSSESGVPILKDIPWIGKWLFSKVVQSESRTELLIFMTPYVLTDGEAAQAEALRRKKTMSDARPWEDHGWSTSPLADPVTKREQLRRIKEEWKKQDEERQTRLEIESAKLERVKQLENMSETERKFWLEKHKDELEKEQKEEFEKKMLDKDSQDELKKLAEQVRARKLKEASSEIKKADEEQKAESPNEHDRLNGKKTATEILIETTPEPKPEEPKPTDEKNPEEPAKK